jgi:origin recognition complex subunit 3
MHHIKRLLLSINDVETFDTGTLSELVSTFASWTDRIPFVFFISIATTIELFEARLAKSTASLLDAKVFELSDSHSDMLYHIYHAVQHDPEATVFLAPAVLSVLADMAEDQSTSTDSFTRAIKYLFMSHFFANPLSVLNADFTLAASNNEALCQAIRTTASFKQYCESLARGSADNRKLARDLIKSDDDLLESAANTVKERQKRIRNSLDVVEILGKIYICLDLPRIAPFDFEIQLLSSMPHIFETDIYKDIEDSLSMLDKDKWYEIIYQSCDNTSDDSDSQAVAMFRSRLEKSENGKLSVGLMDNSVQDNSGSPTGILRLAIEEALTCSPNSTNPNPEPNAEPNPNSNSSTNPLTKSFMSEAISITTRSPLTTILHPTPRYAIERALTRPADYLGCECCISSTSTGTSNTPHDRSTLAPTSLILTMLNEAGTIINVRDLWDTFNDMLEPTPTLAEDSISNDNVDGEPKKRQYLALFYRGLSELRHLGFIRPSKRKPGVECIAKTVWMGL